MPKILCTMRINIAPFMMLSGKCKKVLRVVQASYPGTGIAEMEVNAEIDETVVAAQLMEQAMSDGIVTFTI